MKERDTLVDGFRWSMATAQKIVDAIRTRRCVAFTYRGRRRFVEPQTVGVSVAGHIVLRGYERGTDASPGARKLFDVEKMERFRVMESDFRQAQPGHNPHDSAMSPIIASLPPPE